MNKRIFWQIFELAKQADIIQWDSLASGARTPDHESVVKAQKFAQLIVRECINKIETYRIPVGNSAAGEMACEWTHAALKEIRDDIKETFGVE
jgi:hypothetical protein